MRILFIHESAGHHGGAETNILDTATEFKSRGHAVALAALRKTGRGDEEWTSLFGDHLLFPKSREEWSGLLDLFNPDILYIHKWEELPSLRQLIDSGHPTIRMVHDHDLYCLRTYKYHPVTRCICDRPAGAYCVFPCLAPLQRNRGGWFPVRWLSFSKKLRELKLNRRINRLVVASTYMRWQLEINRFDPTHIEIIPPVPRSTTAIESSFAPRNHILYAGQIVRGKGVDILIQALAQVKTPFTCSICGDGSHRSACEALVKELGLQEKIRFHGFLPRARIQELYQDASIALVSSVWPEPFGLVGLEAMRCGLPVVAFDAGGIRDWLNDGENGFLVPWMNTREYAARIDQLLSDKNRARAMGLRGREILRVKYDFGAYVDSLEKLFQKVKRC